MATNEFLPFGTNVGANVMSQSEYSAMAARVNGFSSGTANSAQLNKAWRQASVIASVVAQFASDGSGQDVLDDGDTVKVLSSLSLAISNAIKSTSISWSKIISKPTTVDGYGITDALKLSGGTLTGPLNMANGTSIYLNTASQASWVAGLITGTQGGETAGAGFTGNASTVASAFLGIGSTPWSSGNGVRVTSGGVAITGAISGNGSGLTNLAWNNILGKPSTLAGYGITDAYNKTEVYTKSETNNAITSTANALVGRDGIDVAGLVGGDETRPYMRNVTNGSVLILQRALGFTPVQQGGGIGQATNKVYLGMSAALNRPAITVDTTNFGGVAFLSDIPVVSPITKEFGSAPQIISNGGLVALTHGLGAVPKIVTGELICVTAENGWAVGDIQHISLSPDNDDAGVVTGFATRKDATSIYARCGTSGPYGVNINNGATAVPTAANWRLVLRAFA
ncbi:Phage tail fiber protein [Pseudomonas synxantha]|uniref:Phage tail fiber protein n=1 Tax=Pseudomonas synxantha TaxID=47883 RepID=A0A3G7U479_9PSED|nr:hypothetical protein [Pseudomonas synxantha]AZE53488.1 Phage tail fiber protein [Pseudomonas synxantha]